MSFDTYADLQAEIRSFLWDRTDVVAKIPTFISLAESEMRRLLRTRQVIRQTPFTVSAGTSGLPCCTSEVLTIQIALPGSDVATYDLDYVSPEAMDQWSGQSASRPRFYTILGDRLYFLPVPDQSYSGHMRLRDGFPSLSASNRCNWILEKHPDIYLAGALKWAKRWLIDQDQDWETPFLEGIAQANRDQPMRQRNTTLRTDGVAGTGGAYNVYSDTYGGR